MSDQTTTQLAAISSLDEDDVMLIIEDGTAKKVTVAQLRSALGAPYIFYDTTLSIDTATFDVTGIPPGYRYLSGRMNGRGTNVSTYVSIRVTFNGDTGATQYLWRLASVDAGVNYAADNGDPSIRAGDICAASGPANGAGSFKFEVEDYSNTTFYKQLLWEAGMRYDTAAGEWTGGWGEWDSTAAIDRVTLTPSSGSWKAGSRLTLELH